MVHCAPPCPTIRPVPLTQSAGEDAESALKDNRDKGLKPDDSSEKIPFPEFPMITFPLKLKYPVPEIRMFSLVATCVPLSVMLEFDGAAPAPPPLTKVFAVRAALVAHVLALEKYGMPPLVPATVSAGVVVGVATEIRPPVKETLVTVAALVLQVEQEIAPAALMAMGDVPLNPAEPTAVIGNWPVTSAPARFTAELVTVCVLPAK